MIIDFHTHIFSTEALRERTRLLEDPQFRNIYESEKARLIDHDELLSAMNGAGIDYAVAMGFSWEREELAATQNDYLREVPELSDGRIIPFGSLPVAEDTDVAARVSEIRDMGFRGIGEVSFYRSGMTPGRIEFLHRLLEAASLSSLPVCLHVNEPVGHRYPGKYEPGLGELYGVLSDHTDARVILSHWGGGLLFYELMPEVREALKKCSYDTAASPYLYHDSIYGIASDITGSGKILFGSDYPLVSHRRYLEPIGKIENEEFRSGILGGNAARLLGVSGTKPGKP
ncbi:MAG: amidohydrolase family protein, partial [Spirochaetes bacterium]|nr:amidohydrolase family protein [Spirochaetota bacterium]